MHFHTSPHNFLLWAVSVSSSARVKGWLKVSWCSSHSIPQAALVEACFMFAQHAMGPQGALFTEADTPGAAESSNWFRASLSCLMPSVQTWISHTEKWSCCVTSTDTFKEYSRTKGYTQRKTVLCEVRAAGSLIAWLKKSQQQTAL